MAKPIYSKSLAQSELRRKYTEDHWENKRKFLTEDFFREKEGKASGPRGSYKSRYVNCFDSFGQVALVAKEWFRADGSKGILILQMVEETEDAICIFTPNDVDET